MTSTRSSSRRGAIATIAGALACAIGAAPRAAWAQLQPQPQPVPQRGAPGDRPVPPLPPPSPAADSAAAAAAANRPRTRTASLPARGLFAGDQLSPAARSRLTELVVDALGARVEVALLVPTGPWQIDGSGSGTDGRGDGDGERSLTPARLDAIRRFLAERGIDPKRLYVESRIDAKVSEPRLDVQLITVESGE